MMGATENRAGHKLRAVPETRLHQPRMSRTMARPDGFTNAVNELGISQPGVSYSC